MALAILRLLLINKERKKERKSVLSSKSAIPIDLITQVERISDFIYKRRQERVHWTSREVAQTG